MPPRPRGGQPVREGLRWVTGRRDMALRVRAARGREHVRLQLQRVAAEARRREVGRRGQLRLGPGGHVDRLADRLVAHGSPATCAAELDADQHGRARRRWHRHGLGAEHLAMAFAWSIPLGVGGAGFITAANAISQQESPSDMRSRLMALQAVAFLGSTPIGSPITGWIADTVSAPWSLAYGGDHQPALCGGRLGLPDGAAAQPAPSRWPPKWLRSAGPPQRETDRVPATIEDFEPFIDDVIGAPRDAGTVELVVCRPAVGERRVLDTAELEPGSRTGRRQLRRTGEHQDPRRAGRPAGRAERDVVAARCAPSPAPIASGGSWRAIS